jgi:hypothetical protein
MSEAHSLTAWQIRLRRQGHQFLPSADAPATGFRLCPSPESIITVAVEADVVLRAPYRQRFFECALEPEPILRAIGCPKLHRNRWLEHVTEQPERYWHDFLAGPGSWLLARLARFPEVIFWAEGGLSWERLDDPLHDRWGMVVPRQAAPFFAPDHDWLTHRVLTSDPWFPDVIASCLLFASVGDKVLQVGQIAMRELPVLWNGGA